MFDNLRCEYPLPDPEVQDEIFQMAHLDNKTKDMDCFMDNYTITRDGYLILHQVRHEEVPEEERPYFGKPEWKDPLHQLCGCIRSIPVGDVKIATPFIGFYTMVGGTWYEYEAEFSDGKVSTIRKVESDSG